MFNYIVDMARINEKMLYAVAWISLPMNSSIVEGKE